MIGPTTGTGFASVETTGLEFNRTGKLTEITMTWDLRPQPSSEQIYLGVLELDPSRFRSILTSSYCTIPEPETWFLMMVGMGFVGAQMRRFKPEVLAK